MRAWREASEQPGRWSPSSSNNDTSTASFSSVSPEKRCTVVFHHLDRTRELGEAYIEIFILLDPSVPALPSQLRACREKFPRAVKSLSRVMPCS